MQLPSSAGSKTRPPSPPRRAVHDLGVKASKVVEFLRDKRPVMVTVSLTPQHMIREEPGRRGVLAKVRSSA